MLPCCAFIFFLKALLKQTNKTQNIVSQNFWLSRWSSSQYIKYFKRKKDTEAVVKASFIFPL